MTGCTHFEEPVAPEEIDATTRVVIDEEIINPEALRASAGIANANNPYSYKNMQKAAVLMAKYWGTPAKPVGPTHYYVRFLPKDSLELKTLEDNYNLELFDYPIDRELTNAQIDFYRDDYTNGFCCWKYTLVPRLYWSFPEGIQKEILDEASIQGVSTISRSSSTMSADTNKNPERSLTVSALTDSDYDLIVEQSMKSAGMTPIGSGGGVCAPYSPSAQISCEDDLLKKRINLERVKVRVNTFFNIGTGYTNANGLVVIDKGWGGKFRNPVHYKVKFKTDEWKILDNTTGIAEIYGPKQTDRWCCIITLTDRKNSCFAAIHRALDYMYFKQTEIATPGLTNCKLRIAAKWNQDGNGRVGQYAGFLEYLGPLSHAISIWGISGNQTYSHSYLLSSTFHELGHASLANRCNGILNALQKEQKIREGYANTVEYNFDKQIYPNVSGYDLLTGLTDNYNGFGPQLLAQGFTMSQLETAVSTAKKWNGWKNNINAMTDKPISQELVNYFFEHPNDKIQINFCQSSIQMSPTSNHYYIGQSIQFNLQQTLHDSNFRIKNWRINNCSPSGYELKDTINHVGGKIIFKGPGKYVVNIEISIPNGPTYEQSIPLEIEDFPEPTGELKPRIGVLTKYKLDDYQFFKKWEVLKYDTKIKDFVVCNSRNRYFITQTTYDKSFSVVFTLPGNYKILAYNSVNGKELITEMSVLVNLEGVVINENDYSPSLCDVVTWCNSATDEIKHTVFLKQFNQIPDNPLYYFKTFNEKPFKDHPYYDDLVAVQIHNNYGNTNFCAYWTGGIFSNNSGPNAAMGTTVFYILKTCKPGTIPIYAEEVLIYDSKLVFANRYLRLTQGTTKNEWLNYYQKLTTDYGIIGYVYPSS